MFTGPINQADPVNWSHPINQGLAALWIPSEHAFGGPTFLDLVTNKSISTTGMTWEGGDPGGLSVKKLYTADSPTIEIPVSSEFTVFGRIRPIFATNNSTYLFWNVADTTAITITYSALYLYWGGGLVISVGVGYGTLYSFTLTYKSSLFTLYLNGNSVGTYAATAAIGTTWNVFSDPFARNWSGLTHAIGWSGRAWSADDAAGWHSECVLGFPSMLNRLRLPAIRPAPSGAFPWYLDSSAMSGGLQTMGL